MGDEVEGGKYISHRTNKNPKSFLFFFLKSNEPKISLHLPPLHPLEN